MKARRMKLKYLFAADVGGTKTEVVLAVANRDWPGIIAQHVYPSREFETLDAVIADFLARPEAREHAASLDAACICVAGPVEADHATTTNLSWAISASELGERFAVPAVKLVNDFAAAAVGIARIEQRDLETLQQGEAVTRGTRAIVGAGTGLGVALMTASGESYVVHPSEAGHADFAPLDEIQDGLLACLRRVHGRVSYERVLSGAGLAQIFRFLMESRGDTPSSAMLEALERKSDDAAVVSEFGLTRRDPVAVRALDVFAAIYGAFAGNIALTVLARGGVYIAGGIAPKIAAKLKDGTLVRAFTNKGRFSDLLSTIPLQVVMNSRVGLYGALDLAGRLAETSKSANGRRPRQH
jgi:glucokinase